MRCLSCDLEGGKDLIEGIVVAGKYTPLENYLRALPKNKREVKLSFEQIEGILNGSATQVALPHDGDSRPPRAVQLPSSAYEDERWWMHETEGNHVNKRAWANAGWKIESVDVNKKWVKLVRVA